YGSGQGPQTCSGHDSDRLSDRRWFARQCGGCSGRGYHRADTHRHRECDPRSGRNWKRSLNTFEIRPVANAREAVAEAIRLAREGKIEGIMKGTVSTEEFIRQIISTTKGLRTERRISHVHALDTPTYPKPLFITDSMINIAPGLWEKREICQNAIDL